MAEIEDDKHATRNYDERYNQNKRKPPTSSTPVKKTTKVEQLTHEDEPTVPTPEELIAEELEMKKSEEGEDSSSPRSASDSSDIDQLALDTAEKEVKKLKKNVENIKEELASLKDHPDREKYNKQLDKARDDYVRALEELNVLLKEQAQSKRVEMKRQKLKTLEALVAKNWPGTKINFRIVPTGSKYT